MTYTVEFEGDANLKVQDLTITGNTYLSNVVLDASPDLQSVTSSGNTTTQSLQITSAEASTSKLTGAIQVAGGVGVEGNVHVGSNLFVAGNVTGNVEFGTANLFVDSLTGNIGIGTTEPTESLDIVGNLNLQKVSNTASIKLNSNVVTEFVRSKKLMKYPRVAMTAATTAGYTASASSTYSSSFYAWEAFDGKENEWISGENSYNSDGTASGASAVDTFQGIAGSWLGIKLPSKIKLESIIIKNRGSTTNRNAEKGIIWATNDGTNWVRIRDFSDLNTAPFAINTIQVHQETVYNEYRLQITEMIAYTSGGSPAVSISDWELFGVPEYDPEADGTDVIVRSVPNVPNTDWLEVYYDGRDFSGTPTSITDKSGNNITATANNITIDTTYQSFEFTQSPKSNIIADNVSFVSGDQQHSIALWFRLKNKNQHNLLFDYRDAGGSTTTGTATGLYVTSYNTGLQFFHQGTDKQVDFDFIQHTWYHLIGTYAGGGGFSGSTIYINGIDVGGVVSGTNTVLDLPATGTITIGDYLHASYGMGDGSIANFRLFNRALSADEIWQLYAYQKEYFGHGNLDMTLKSGRLGIGTSEPRAVLDVRGTLRAHGSVVQVVTNPVVGQYAYTGNGTEVEMAALRTSFKPKFSDSLVLVQVYLSYEADFNAVIYIRANNNDIPTGQGRTYGDKEGVIPVAYDVDRASTPNSSNFVVHHILNGESTVEYKIFYRPNGSGNLTIRLNRAYDIVDEKGMCYVIITEIAQ